MEDHDVDDASIEASPSNDDEDESRELMVVDSMDIDASITEKWRERKRLWDNKKTTISEIVRLNHDEFCQLLSIDPNYDSDNHGEDGNFVSKAKKLFSALTSQHSDHEGLQGETAAIEELRSENRTLTDEIRNLEQQESSDDSLRYGERLIQVKQRLIQANQRTIQDKQRLIQANQRLIQANQQKMIDDFSLYIGKILDVHEKVALQLSIYRTKGNETYSKSEDHNTRQYSENLNRIDPKMEPSPTIADVALRNPQVCGDIQAEIVGDLGDEVVQAVREFESFFHELMAKATMADKVKDTTMALSKTIDAIRNQKIEDKTIYLKPSETKDEETKVEQPIARAILHKILGLVNGYAFVTSEQYLSPVAGYLGARRVDFLAHSTREHMPNLSLHHMITASVEVKASLKTKTDQKMTKGENQNVGHMSKRILASFHLMGVGRDEVLYGITMSLNFVSVVRMKLSGVGTPQAKVSCDRTERIAIGSSKNDAFLVIAGAMMLSLKNDTTSVTCFNLQGHSVGGESQLNLENFLGAGAFSNVYIIGDGEFLKLPKSAKAWKNVRREAFILTTLACAKVPNVPTAPREVALKLALRGQVGQCSGLELKGIIGKPAERFHFKEKGELFQVMRVVSTTLSCAHSFNIIHLDVRPSNIIVSRASDDNDVTVMLSDWGCAVQTTDKIFFHGCIPFAHDELLQEGRTKTKPKKGFDWASFIYTFYCLQTGSLPWSNDITTRNCGQPAIVKRLSAVERWWSDLPHETQKEFQKQKDMSGIGKRKRQPVRRSPRNNSKKPKR